MTNNSPRRLGFSLLELSIVLTIVAVMVAGGLSLTTAKVGQDQLENTYDEMVNVQKALQSYVTEYGKLPCPADITLARSNVLYGREATDCADATPPAGITRVEYPASSGKYVRIGGVPFYTLQMPERYLDDSFNNRYYYAVSESFITSATSTSVGNIRVIDLSGTSISDEVAYTLFSSGRTHKGAYVAKTGTLNTTCSSVEKDGENCDNDGIFTDAPYNDGTQPAQFYDDIILWQTRMQLFGNTGGGGSSSSSTSSSSGGSSAPWKKNRYWNTADYPLEIKGKTPVSYASNIGLATADAACAATFPSSWVMRSSDLEFIDEVPTSANGAAIIFNSCDMKLTNLGSAYMVCQNDTAITMVSSNSSSQIYNITYPKFNCSDWSDNTTDWNGGSSPYNPPDFPSFSNPRKILISRTSAPTNFRFTGGQTYNYTSCYDNFCLTHQKCTVNTPFVCVGTR